MENKAKIKHAVTNVLQEDYFIEYSTEYMLNRAVPFIEDGLKPIHRRILFDIYYIDKVLTNTLKSAKLVGNIMGNLHPHGDMAIYDAYVNLAQPWKNPYPIVEIHGNNGSIDGDPAASSRYTEGKVTKYGIALAEFLKQIDDKALWKETELQDGQVEPTYFPTLIPNVLINGVTGISLKKVDIPPYNFGEICDLCIKIAEGKNVEKTVLYPDFGDAGGLFKQPLMVYSTADEWKKINQTGDGSFVIYAEIANDPAGLVVLNLPWGVSGDTIVDELVNLTDSDSKKYLSDITDIERLSSKANGFLVRIKLKKNADKDFIRQKLYSSTQLKKSYREINNVVSDGYVKKLGVIEICKLAVANGKKFIKQIYEKLIRDEEKELNIINGLLKLRDHFDEVMKLVKNSDGRDAIIQGLIKMTFNQAQAEHIANMMLHKLAKDQSVLWLKRRDELNNLIKAQTAIIENEKLLTGDYVKRMREYIKEFARPRFTTVLDHDLAIEKIDSKEGKKQLAELKENTTHEIYFDKNGEISYQPIKTKWKFPDSVDLITVSDDLVYFNYLAHNNVSHLNDVYKAKALKLLSVFAYDENKDVLIVTPTKIKRIALSDLKNRVKPDKLINGDEKCLGLYLLDKDDKRIIVGTGASGSLAFPVSEVAYQVKGSGIVFAKEPITKCELLKTAENIRHRGYTLK